jgi:predicted kinase
MFPSIHSPTLSAPFVRKAVAVLMGATFLATPVTATRARAQATAATTGIPVAATAIETKGETVRQRIIGLNAAVEGGTSVDESFHPSHIRDKP